jgi:hypothetical protein
MEMRTLVDLAAWLAARAGVELGMADAGRPLPPGSEATTADRAGRLVPVPQEGLEPEVTRSLGMHWALWLAVGIVLLILAVGYIRRKWRAQGDDRPGWLTRRGRR